MDYSFGCARPLYEQKVHPRVMLGPDGLARLKVCTRTGEGRRVLSALRERVSPFLQLIEEWNPAPGTVSRGNRPRIGVPLADIAMVGLLDEDERFLKAAVKVLSLAPDSDPLGMAYDLLWPYLTPEARQAYCRWAVDSGVRRPLEEDRHSYYRSAGGNGRVGLNLYRPLLAILAIQGDEGVPDLAPELQESLRRLQATLNVVFTPDGYPEEDIGYGTMVAGTVAPLVEATRRAGLFDAYRQCPRYARFGQAILHFVQPWGLFLSNTGDHGDDFTSREFILARMATETKDPTLLWLLGTLTYPSAGHDVHVANRARHVEVALSDELPSVPVSGMSLLALDDLMRKPARPAQGTPTQFVDRRRGLVSLRSGWGDDDTLVIFDGSQRAPSAQGHAHASCGHFSLSALGEYFAIDTGRYNMEQNCHNVVLIDGKSGRSTDGAWGMSLYYGNLTDYLPGDFVDFAAVDSSLQHNCYWAWRYLGLVKGGGAPAYVWTVENINKNNDWGEYWWQLHTSPENVITLKPDGAVIQGWRHGNLLDVRFVLPSTPQEYARPHALSMAQDIATPSSYNYIQNPQARAAQAVRPSDQVHHAVFVRPRLLAKVAGYNGSFMSLMLPRRKGDAPALVERLSSVPNSLAVKITFPDVEDILIFAYDHNLLEAGDVRGRGQWCVVRRSRQTGEVLAHALGHGVSLEIGGKVLVTAPDLLPKN